MGRKFVLVGDIGTDHDGFPPTPVTAGSPSVLIDGKPVARLGDPLAPHDKPKHSAHPRSIAEGSGTILIDGKPAALTGHAVSCGGVMNGGASAVGDDTGAGGHTTSLAALSAVDNEAAASATLAEATQRQATQELTLSEAGKQWLRDVEQLRLRPYDDQTGQDITSWVGGATIGYGHLISRDDWHLYQDGINEEQADQLFEKDIVPYLEVVNSEVSAQLTQSQFDAAVVFSYNIGTNAFRNSSAVKLINDPEAKTLYSSVEEAWKAFNRSQGVVNQGLVNRRAAEWDMYSKGEYRRW
ncbi:MAG TPA: type VI secretion system PAAR protein [Candidatus Halomonas stercoripullorum]|uniref:Lysozyme n=1 Tax=Candidatus Halomonas stercoripullorum TaxID=2838617 RepID=A0A9D2B502_9GAMM|nr:type VI secretion system PAAR protein [Candidatus Halomonas stercoripullorum]